MESTASLEMRVGILVIAGIVILVALVIASDRVNFEDTYPITVQMDNAGGLNVGSPVTLAGIRIGSVEAIRPAVDRRGIEAVVRVSERYRLYRSSTITVGTSGIFGDSFIAFSPPAEDPGEPLPEDGSAVVRAERTFLDRASTQAQVILEGMAEILGRDNRANAKRILASGATIADEGAMLVGELRQHSARLGGLIVKVEQLSDALYGVQAELGARGSEAMVELRDSLRSVRASTENLEQRLVSLSAQAESTLERGEAVLALGEEAMREGNVAEAAADLRGLAADLRAIAGDLRAGRGVLGQLIVNEAMAKDLNDTLITASQVAERVADHPEILVWGAPEPEAAKAREQRRQEKMRRAFMEGYLRHPRAETFPVEISEE